MIFLNKLLPEMKMDRNPGIHNIRKNKMDTSAVLGVNSLNHCSASDGCMFLVCSLNSKEIHVKAN